MGSADDGGGGAAAEARLPTGYADTKFCELRWARSNGCPPFSNVSIFLDLGRAEDGPAAAGGGALTPSLATVCALYGVDLFSGADDEPPLWLATAESAAPVLPDGRGVFDLQRGQLYYVHMAPAAAELQLDGVHRIKSMLHALGEDRIRALSAEFYRRVYADRSNAAFRALFAAVATEDEAIQNQADFLVEMFGVTAHNSARVGPDGAKLLEEAEGLEMTGTPYSDRWGEGQLVPRTIGKHHAAIMNMRFATIWLSHMVAAARYAH